jgi:hypothetical protein
MGLASFTALVVIVAFVVVGAAGYLLDRSADPHN